MRIIKKLIALVIVALAMFSLFSAERPTFALVLSGGGARGIAHIAVLEELEKRGLNAGILVQATIGHGYSVGVKPPFQNIIAVDGTPSFTICPYDEDFRTYIRDGFAEIAKRKPTSIMVDDDFRLFARGK